MSTSVIYIMRSFLFDIVFLLQDHGGVVISITATLQVRGQAFQTHAGAAKAAIGQYVRASDKYDGPDKGFQTLNTPMAGF